MSATWPKSGAAMKEEGYRSTGQGKCRGCGATIVWTVSPAGKNTPISILGNDRWQPHFIDCPKRGEFKKKKEGIA